MFISDLDGTLLNNNESLSDYTISVLNEIVKRGIAFSYATARSFISASLVTKGFKPILPVVVYNGTFIADSQSATNIFANYFSVSEVDFIKTVLIEHGFSPIVYSYIDNIERFSFVSEATNRGKTEFLSTRIDFRRREVFAVDSLYTGDVFYCTCVGNPEKLKRLETVFKKDGRFNCLLYREIYTKAYFFELMPKGVSKASAVKKLKEILGIDKIVAFGDAVNDIPLFEISDERYAVLNADPKLKQLATAIIDSNENDGVAKWLAKNLL